MALSIKHLFDHQGVDANRQAFMRAFIAGTDDFDGQQHGCDRLWDGRVRLYVLPHGDALRILEIEAKRTGCGDGSAGLDWLCALADRHYVSLDTLIYPFNKTGAYLNDKVALRAWYGRRGFVGASLNTGRRAPKSALDLPYLRKARLSWS